MKGTSSHSAHLDHGQGGCLFPHVETLILNGTSVSHSQVRAVCPGHVSDPQADSYTPSEHWVCREITVPPTSSCQMQSGLSRSQTVVGKSVGSQKPPIHDGVRRVNTTRVTAHHGPAACHERVKPFEQMWRTTPPMKANGAESEPLSPSLDETIENLNNLILELDPTFQPISTCVKRDYLASSSKRQLDRPSEDVLLDVHSPGILIYDEWDSGTPQCGSTSISSNREPDSPGLGLQTTAISSTAPFYRMPALRGHEVLNAAQTDGPSPWHSSHTSAAFPMPQFGASPESRIAESLINSSKAVAQQRSRQIPESLCLATDSSLAQQSSHPITVPASSSYTGSVTNSLPHQHSNMPINMALQREDPRPYLSTSVGSDHLLSSYHPQHRLGDSTSSLLSTSPGWDTLGSSHSLLSDDGEAGRIYRSAGTMYGSSGSFVNLKSPYLVSPSSCKSSFNDQQLYQTPDNPGNFRTLPLPRKPANSPHPQGSLGSAGPGQVLMQQGQSVHKIKKHANSCPASAANSCNDIPLLLVNGSTQFLEQDSHRTRTQRLPSSSSSLPRKACSTKELSKSSSTTSLADLSRDAEPTVKFVQDTTKYWYKPNITRDQAIEMLKDKEPGSFIIRESSTYIGSFGLAMQVSSSSPENPEKKTGDSSSETVRHFLIEFSPKGVCLKGCSQEPYFGSLSALVYQHCITPMSLPNKLRLPRRECLKESSEGSGSDSAGGHASPGKNQGAVCSVLYLNSVTMESLTGPQAVFKAVSCILEGPLPKATSVQFKVLEQGITLTDSKRKVFFRRHYQASSINHCGLDPLQRKWRKDSERSRIFAFVAKKQGSSSENVCHVFAELEQDNSAHHIIGLVTRTVLEPQKR